MNNIVRLIRESSFGRFFIPLGIILVVVGFIFFNSINNTKNYIKTDAIVTRVELAEEAYYDGETHHEATYNVFVQYTVDGKEYNQEYGIFSNYKQGDKVTISYNPENPNEIAQPISIAFPIVLIIGGIASLVAGTISIVKAIKKYKNLKLQEEEWKSGQ